VTRIPDVKRELGLSHAELGLALLAQPAGALLAMAACGHVVARHGSRTVVALSAPALAASLPLPVLAPDLGLLAVALFLVGLATGALEVSMNAHGVAVEREHGRPTLALFHAAFSLGGLAGSGTGAAVAGFGVAPEPHLGGVGLAFFVIGLALPRRLLPADADHAPAATGLGLPIPRLALIGFLVFCCLLAEGAMADWSAVYLRDSVGAGAAAASLGYAAFSATMLAGRLCGDWMTLALGPVALARLGSALAAGGLLVAVTVPHPLVGIAGFAAVGAGLAPIIPTFFRAAAAMPGIRPGVGISAASTIGFFGFLVGPPLVGFVASATSLGFGLALVAGLIALIALRAEAVAPSPARAESETVRGVA
jgi:predicted MFS family arabinose efflux permease